MIKKSKYFLMFTALIFLSFAGGTTAKAEDQSRHINVNEAQEDMTFGDTIYYYFNVNSDGYVNIDFEHENLTQNETGWAIKLYDIESNYLTGMDSYKTKTLTRSNTVGLKEGQYYAVVYSRYGTNENSYKIKVNFNQSNQWEKEFNNEISTAQKIPLNNEIAGSLANDSDEDYFLITLPQNGYVNLEFNHENLTSSDAGWTISLYDKDSNYLTGITSYKNKTKTKGCNVGLTKGDYYIKIKRNYYDGANYTLKVNYKESENWEKEYNETILTANPIKLERKIYGSIRDGYDNDYYKISINKNTKIRLKFLHKNYTDSSTGWVIRLYNDKSDELTSFDSMLNNTKTYSNFVVLPKGTYYVKVQPNRTYNYNAGDYSLTLSTK